MKKVSPNLIIFPLIVVLSAVLLIVMLNNDYQAITPIPLKASFQGEYSINGGEWREISAEEKIVLGKGEICLRGYFQLETPDGTPVGKVPKDTHLITFFNHIGGYMSVDGEIVHEFDMENKHFGNSSCGEAWVSFDCPAEETEVLEITLINPHSYGNGNGAQLFLSSLCTYGGAAFNEQMTREGEAQRTAGIVIMVVSFIVIGVAIFSTVLKVPYNRLLWIFGLMLLFAGGFCVLDSPKFSLCGLPTVFITTARSLCIILYPGFMFCFAENCLRENLKKIGGIVSGIYGILSAGALIAAITGVQLIYDLNFYLLIAQLAAAVVFAVLCILSFRGSEAGHNLMNAVCLGSLLALAADIAAVFLGVWHTAVVSKAVFAAVFAAALVYSLKFIPTNIKAGIHEKELQLELQENKVAVMLSQIQPHFLYNALTAICDLCGTSPLKARDALVDFSVYLRENMDSISTSEPVKFYKELSHIKTYIKLEKLRFGDKINVVYDIGAENFEIQPLTVQPIVENAVKHGISKKEKGGTVTLKTEEQDGIVTVTVMDDGVGFDVNAPREDNDRSHLGLENVRKRVENYPEGRFTVESEKGKGTVVTISFRKRTQPKKEQNP